MVTPSRESPVSLKVQVWRSSGATQPTLLLHGWPGRSVWIRTLGTGSPGGCFYRILVLAGYMSFCKRALTLGKSEFCLCGPGKQTWIGSHVLRVSWHQSFYFLFSDSCARQASFRLLMNPSSLLFPSLSHPLPQISYWSRAKGRVKWAGRSKV